MNKVTDKIVNKIIVATDKPVPKEEAEAIRVAHKNCRIDFVQKSFENPGELAKFVSDNNNSLVYASASQEQYFQAASANDKFGVFIYNLEGKLEFVWQVIKKQTTTKGLPGEKEVLYRMRPIWCDLGFWPQYKHPSSKAESARYN